MKTYRVQRPMRAAMWRLIGVRADDYYLAEGSVSRGCVLAKPADDLLCSAALRGPVRDGDVVVKFGC